MAQIKQTVELLTKILRSNGTSRIKPETFRQAKFNKDDATEAMWRLLFEVLYYLKYRMIDDITIKAYMELTKVEVCVYVKTEMKMRGFVSKTFHELPNDMSHGSRELLLAFGWLMCRSNLIDVFMEQCCSCLDTEAALTDEKNASLQLKPSKTPSLNIKDKVSYLKWLNGKLRMSLKNLHNLQRQKSNLVSKIETSTSGVSTHPEIRDHLTVLEVMMLKNPDLLKKNLKLLEADNQRLEALITWQQHDDIFWKWMESVLDAKLSETGVIEEISETITPRTFATKEWLDQKLKITESVNKYSTLVTQMEQDILSKRSTTLEDIDSLLGNITTDIARYRVNLLNSLPSVEALQNVSSAEISSTPVARIKPLQRQQPSKASSVASVSVAEDELLKMETELTSLQALVDRLQADIEYKQVKCNDELSSLSSGMESLYEHVSRGPTIFKSQHTA